MSEFLLTGGATFVLLPLAWLARRALGLDAAEYAFGFTTFYAAYVVNDPHFAVTYLLFYRDARRLAFDRATPPAQRARLWIAGAIVPAALVAWGAVAIATHAAQALGGMIELMYLLVGWHYVKQGSGVLAVLSARRGASFSANERRVILAHCYAAWAFAWANPATPARALEERGVVYFGLAHPRGVEIACGVALAASVVALVWTLFAKWRRERRALAVATGPLVAFLVTLWSWTMFSAIDPLFRYVIPALHSIQYGYFVWLLRRSEARVEEAPPFFKRPASVRLAVLFVSAVALGWLLFHGAPGVLDAALVRHDRRGGPLDDLGATPFVAAFYVIVNVHHFVMDGVLWRRENPAMRHLIC